MVSKPQNAYKIGLQIGMIMCPRVNRDTVEHFGQIDRGGFPSYVCNTQLNWYFAKHQLTCYVSYFHISVADSKGK